jgi:GNAT superfamily N-acetyltransferase
MKSVASKSTKPSRRVPRANSCMDPEPSSPPTVRAATASDAGEILRLAYLMWEDMGVTPRPGDWEVKYQKTFADEVEGSRMRAFVVDDPAKPGVLIACGVAWNYPLLPAFWLPNGEMGYLQWFYTDPNWRRRGIASAVLDTCVAWLMEQGCTHIQLHSSPAAEIVYVKSGFHDTNFKNMWLVIDESRPI